SLGPSVAGERHHAFSPPPYRSPLGLPPGSHGLARRKDAEAEAPGAGPRTTPLGGSMNPSAKSRRRHPIAAIAVLATLIIGAPAARAQMIVDGLLFWNNNASGTLAGQFVGTTSSGPLCTGKTPAQFGTVDMPHNSYADPIWSVTNPPEY